MDFAFGLGGAAFSGSLYPGALSLHAKQPYAELFTPQGLSYELGTHISVVATNQLPGGVSRQVTVVNRYGVNVVFQFLQGQSAGVPIGRYERQTYKLVMVDDNGQPVTENPKYYELRYAVGSLDRYAADGSLFGQFVYFRTSQGRVETLSDSGIEVLKNNQGGLRQVKTPQCLVDIVASNQHGYSLIYYSPASAGTKGTNGFYEPSGSSFVTWRIEQPDTSTVDRIRVVKLAGNTSEVYDFIYTDYSQKWTLISDGGLRQENKWVMWDDGRENRIDTYDIQDGKSGTGFREEQQFHVFPWGEDMVKKVEDPAGLCLVTTNSYYTDPAETGRYSRLMGQIRPSGSWTKYDYDSSGRLSLIIRPWKDISYADGNATNAKAILNSFDPVDTNDTLGFNDQRPRTITEKVAGVIVSTTFHVYKEVDGSTIEIEEKCADLNVGYGDSSNLRTVREYYPTDDMFRAGLLKTLSLPDGRQETHDYEKGGYSGGTTSAGVFVPGSGEYVRQTKTLGTTDFPEGIPYKTTREVWIRNAQGKTVLEETYVYTGSGYTRVAWTVNNYDELSHLTNTLYSNGTHADATWNEFNKISETDVNGIETTFTYDNVGRVITRTKKGISAFGEYPAQEDIVTSNRYDVFDNLLTETVSGGVLSLLTTKTYDQAKRLVSALDEAGLVISNQYSDYGRTKATIRPGGATEVTETYLDGRIKAITGTAAISQFYDYGVNQDGSTWTLVHTSTTNSPMWEKTISDNLDRIASVEKPGFGGAIQTNRYFYNNQGQQARSSRPGIADMIYDYDELGRRFRSGLDIDANDALDMASSDRITETTERYVQLDDEWWKENSQTIYPNDGSATGVVVAVRREAVGGSGCSCKANAWVSIDAYGNVTSTATDVYPENKVVTQTVIHPDSTNAEVEVIINGLLVSQTTKTGVKTTHLYDGLGRRIRAESSGGSRSVATVTHYNDKGQVDYTEDAVGNRTTYTYDVATGRPIGVTDPLTNVVYTAYDIRGQVTNTWGSTYPVAYVYDGVGRMIEMRTKRAAPDAGDVTRWCYDSASGLLTNKQDAAGKGALYTYTADGKLASRTWVRNSRALVTSYLYDTNTAELVKIDYSDTTPDVTFSYDRLGRQKTIADAVGTRAFAYGSDLQPLSETITGLYTKAITRLYETNGVKGRSAGFMLGAPGAPAVSNYVVNYSYDTLGRFAQVAAAPLPKATNVFKYTYLPNSDLIAQLTNSAGILTVSAYETNRNLKTVIENRYRTNVVSRYEYASDAAGRRKSVKNSGSAFSAETNAFNLYQYNIRSEVTDARRYLGTDPAITNRPVTSQRFSYDYDLIGNRLFASNSTQKTTYGANALNQYMAMTNPAQSFGYDDDGNMTNWISGTNRLLYVWDAENRLAGVGPVTPTNDGLKVEFKYDYMGRRVQKLMYRYQTNVWRVAGDQRFVYDGWNMIQQWSTNNATRTTNFVWGLDLSQRPQGAGGIGGLLMMAAGQGTTTNRRAYVYDANGNVGQVLEMTNGAIAAHYEYDPYGNPIKATGTFAAGNPYRFSTKYLDSEVGGTNLTLYYYGYRFYSTGLGRWLNRDPIGDSVNRLHPEMALIEGKTYAFVNNQPTVLVDPLGLAPSDDPCQTAKDQGLDAGDYGGVVCSGGKKYSCVWKIDPTSTRKGHELVAKCVAAHENTHHDDIDCPEDGKCSPVTRPNFKSGKDSQEEECTAHGAERDCLQNAISECGSDFRCEVDVKYALGLAKAYLDGHKCK